MKKLFVLVLVMILFVSCGGSYSTTLMADEYKIEVLSDWENTDWEGYDVFLKPADGSTANVKITSNESSSIKWGRIADVTETYAEDAQEQFGYTLISDGYEHAPQAQREQRYILEFSAMQDGNMYRIIQHIYASKLMVIFVTGTFSEDDAELRKQVEMTMDSFLLAPKDGWE